MSSTLGRAFTTKRAQKSTDISAPLPLRSQTTKQKSMGNLRNKISLPVELISTTNNSVHDHPDIFPRKNPVKHSASISSRSSNSADESDRSPTGTSTPLTSPDSSSVEGSPTTVEPNHLSCYFGGPARQSGSSQDAPIIPQRAVSHTKRTAEALAHQRTVSRTSSSTKTSHQSVSSSIKSSHQSVASSKSGYQSSITTVASKDGLSQARSSINMFSAHVETVEPHPFGRELAQVTELAEEFGASAKMAERAPEKAPILDEDQRVMGGRGLLRFSADDYINEIHAFIQDAFAVPRPLFSPPRPGPVKPALATMWI